RRVQARVEEEVEVEVERGGDAETEGERHRGGDRQQRVTEEPTDAQGGLEGSRGLQQVEEPLETPHRIGASAGPIAGEPELAVLRDQRHEKLRERGAIGGRQRVHWYRGPGRESRHSQPAGETQQAGDPGELATDELATLRRGLAGGERGDGALD